MYLLPDYFLAYSNCNIVKKGITFDQNINIYFQMEICVQSKGLDTGCRSSAEPINRVSDAFIYSLEWEQIWVAYFDSLR